MKYLNKVIVNVIFPSSIVPFEELYFSDKPVQFYSDLEKVKVVSTSSHLVSIDLYNKMLDHVYDLKDTTKYEITGNNY